MINYYLLGTVGDDQERDKSSVSEQLKFWRRMHMYLVNNKNYTTMLLLSLVYTTSLKHLLHIVLGPGCISKDQVPVVLKLTVWWGEPDNI